MAGLIAGADIVFGAPPRPCVSRRAHRHDRSARRATRPRSRSCHGLTTICRRGSRRQADLNTGLYRTVLRRGVSRRLSPEPSARLSATAWIRRGGTVTWVQHSVWAAWRSFLLFERARYDGQVLVAETLINGLLPFV